MPHDREPSLFDELENRPATRSGVKGTEATFPQLTIPTELQARAVNERVPQIA